MKKIFIKLILFLGFSTLIYGHSGRTDSNGSHYNRKTGNYHYHNGKSSSTLFWVVLIGGTVVFFILKSSNKK